VADTTQDFPHRILVVDANEEHGRALAAALEKVGFRTICLADILDTFSIMAAKRVDAILLDPASLGTTSTDFVTCVYEHHRLVPVLVVSAWADEVRRIAYFEAGAYDWIAKLTGPLEIAARIRAALRHALQREGIIPVLQMGDTRIDFVLRQISRRDAPVHLSPREWDILRLLVQYRGRILTHKHIKEMLWNGRGDVQHVRVYIRELRQKLEDDPRSPDYIRTEAGVGYRLTM